MRKVNAKTLLLSAGILAILGVSLSSLGGNRWESRMTKPSSSGTKSTVNLVSGKKVNEDGTQSAATPVPAAVASYGEGTLHCRDTVLKLNTNFENPAAAGVSEVRIAELNHLASKVYNCVDIKPSLVSNAGQVVNAGTMTVKCTNGQLSVTASNCTAPTPPPATPTPTPAATVDPNAPAATPAPPPGYPNASCSSWCSATKSCTRTGGKGAGQTKVNYRSCQNGQYINLATGACLSGSGPANCY